MGEGSVEKEEVQRSAEKTSERADGVMRLHSGGEGAMLTELVLPLSAA